MDTKAVSAIIISILASGAMNAMISTSVLESKIDFVVTGVAEAKEVANRAHQRIDALADNN